MKMQVKGEKRLPPSLVLMGQGRLSFACCLGTAFSHVSLEPKAEFALITGPVAPSGFNADA